MSRVTIQWRADQWRAAAIPALNAGLTAAAAVMADQAVRNMGTQSGGVRGADKSPLAGGPARGRKRIKGAATYRSSRPGDFPGVRTSYLRNSITAVSPEALSTPLHAAFGTAVPYGRYLEFGAIITPRNKKFLRFKGDDGNWVFTKRVVLAARPWIVRSAYMARARASRIFVRVASARLKAAGLSR